MEKTKESLDLKIISMLIAIILSISYIGYMVACVWTGWQMALVWGVLAGISIFCVILLFAVGGEKYAKIP